MNSMNVAPRSRSSPGIYAVSVLLFCASRVASEQAKGAKFSAVYAFGDSILDCGNNNDLKTVTKCNYPPYGKDLPGGKSTGRFSNGKVPTDLIAGELGIKEMVPAYLDPNLRNEDLPTGVCFASGGSGFDSLTSSLLSVLSMSEQLNLFKEYVGKLRAVVGDDNATAIVNNGLYLVSAGNNDIAITYLSARVRRVYAFPTYANFLIEAAIAFFKELYALGARKFAVLSTLPLGCLPSERATSGSLLCSERASQAAELYNTKLNSALHSLNREHADAEFVYVDVHDYLLNLVQNPAKFGFQVAIRGCCGVGTWLCTPVSPFACPDRSTYVFWDAAHPTERAYSIIVQEIVRVVANTSSGNATC